MLNKKIVPDFSPRKPFSTPTPSQRIQPPPPPVVQFPAYVPQKPIPFKNPLVNPPPISQAFTTAHETPMVIKNSVTNFSINTTPLVNPPVLDPNSSFSPNLETFTSAGNSYFLLKGDPQSDVSQWATYPAVSDIFMDGFNINAVGSIAANNVAITNSSPYSLSCVGNAFFQSTIQAQDLTVTSGAIKLTPSHVLETIGGDLFFDTELLAKANDIQQIADWSLYPALSTINMNGNILSNAQQIQTVQLTNASGTFGSAGQVLASDGTKIDWVTPATPGNVSTWATFPASANVDMSGNNLSNAQKIQTVQLTNASGTFGSAGQYLTSDGTTINWITAPSPSDVSTWATFAASSNVSLPNRNLTITSANPGVSYPTASLNANVQIGNTAQAPLRPDFNAYCGAFNIGGITSPATSINLTSIGNVSIAGGAGVSISGGGGVSVAGLGGVAITGVGNLSLAGGDVQVTGAGIVSVGAGGVAITGGGGVGITGGGGVLVTAGTGVSVAGGAGVAVTGGGGVAVTGGSGVQITAGAGLKTELIGNTTGSGTTLAINNVSTINGAVYPPSGSTFFVEAYDIYVAPNGNNTTGTGSQQNPYQTIGRAITARSSISNTIEVSIRLASGTYTESITLVRNTYLVGVPTGEAKQPVNVNGLITMNDTTGNIGIANIDVQGAVTATAGVNGATVFSIFATNILPVSPVAGNSAVSLSNGTMYITETRITGGTSQSNAEIVNSLGALFMRDVVIDGSLAATGLTSNTNTITSLRQCYFTSTSASTAVNPLIKFGGPSGAVVQTIEIFDCKFVYTSSAVDTVGNKCCIQMAGLTGTQNIDIAGCLLICEGATTAVGGQIQCIQKINAGSCNIKYGNLLAGATANHIAPAIVKTQYITVP